MLTKKPSVHYALVWGGRSSGRNSLYLPLCCSVLYPLPVTVPVPLHIPHPLSVSRSLSLCLSASLIICLSVCLSLSLSAEYNYDRSSILINLIIYRNRNRKHHTVLKALL